MRYRIPWIFLLLHVVMMPAIAQETKIAIEPYEAKIDRVSGEIIYGQKIIHRAYDLELEKKIMNVPLFAIQYAGPHDKAGPKNDPSHVKARAKRIAERLGTAWHLLKKGGKLVIGNDNWEVCRLHGRTRPKYSQSPKTCPAIFVVHSELGEHPLRIMTIYDQDVEAFPRIKSKSELANYIRAIIIAHHLLFEQKSIDIEDYEYLDLDLTREGKIFKEIFIRAQEVMSLKEQPCLMHETLEDALARISMPQRQRLVSLSFRALRDWDEVRPR